MSVPKSLELSKENLKTQIRKGLFDAMKTSKKFALSIQQGSSDFESIDEKVSAKFAELASASITDAIHEYVLSAQVDISDVVSTVSPGIPVTAGSFAGATVGLGDVKHASVGKLK